MIPRKKLTALGLCLTIFVSCARGPREPKNGAKISGSHASLSDEREAEMGRQIHQSIVSTFRVYTEPRLVEYVRKIGESVAKSAERKNLPYQFTILYDDRIYATDAPGGFVYITTGFLNFLENEAELAGVLAQEIAQLQYRDPRFSPSQKVLGAASQAGAVVGPFFGPIGALGAVGLVLLSTMTLGKQVSPKKRIQAADRRALRYLVEADQDPQGYLDFLQRLLNGDRMWTPYSYDYLTSRPLTQERYQRVVAEFGKLPLQEKALTVNRELYREMTKGVREIYR